MTRANTALNVAGLAERRPLLLGVRAVPPPPYRGQLRSYLASPATDVGAFIIERRARNRRARRVPERHVAARSPAALSLGSSSWTGRVLRSRRLHRCARQRPWSVTSRGAPRVRHSLSAAASRSQARRQRPGAAFSLQRADSPVSFNELRQAQAHVDHDGRRQWHAPRPAVVSQPGRCRRLPIDELDAPSSPTLSSATCARTCQLGARVQHRRASVTWQKPRCTQSTVRREATSDIRRPGSRTWVTCRRRSRLRRRRRTATVTHTGGPVWVAPTSWLRASTSDGRVGRPRSLSDPTEAACMWPSFIKGWVEETPWGGDGVAQVKTGRAHHPRHARMQSARPQARLRASGLARRDDAW